MIGRVAYLQVQRQPLKQDASYDPSPLLAVEELRVSAHGVLGRLDGGWVVDTHHAAHPHVRGRGLRGVSMGFTSHYEAMAERYGDVPLGVAGENIIVESERRFDASALANGIIIRSSDGGKVVFPAAPPAAPCLEFTSFLLGLPHRAGRDEVAADLDFLGGGMRGFIVDAAQVRNPAPVRLGDEVHLLTAAEDGPAAGDVLR